jgi:hypothetical protein
MPNPYEALLLDFAARAAVVSRPEDGQLYHYAETSLTDGSQVVLLILTPRAEIRSREFLDSAEVQTIAKAIEARLPFPSKESLPLAKPRTDLPKLSSHDLDIVNVIRASPNGQLNTIQIANRLHLSRKNSTLRGRLAGLAAMDVLISSRQHGYRLGPKAPESTPPASRPA